MFIRGAIATYPGDGKRRRGIKSVEGGGKGEQVLFLLGHWVYTNALCMWGSRDAYVFNLLWATSYIFCLSQRHVAPNSISMQIVQNMMCKICTQNKLCNISHVLQLL